MNFNVYVNKRTGEKITKLAKNLRRSRNSIVTEALEEWLQSHAPSRWPEDFFDFSPITDFPDVESLRSDLKDTIPEDPLA